MKTILLIPFSLESHLYPTFQTAKTLQKYGYGIVYAIPAIYHVHTTAQGFSSVALSGFPFGNGFEKENREFEKSTDLYLDVFIDKMSNRIYEDRKRKLTAIIEEIRPSLVLIDSWSSTDFIILYPLAQKYNISLVFMHLMLSTYRKQFSPPLFTPLLPDDKKLTSKVWKELAWQKRKHDLKQAIKYLGHHDSKKIKQKFKENQLPEKHQLLPKENLYNIAFAGVPELVFSAEELEFQPSEKRPNQHYLGGIIYTGRKQTDIDERYEAILDKLLSTGEGTKGLGKSPLIYCAFGTIQAKFVDRIILFLQKLFVVFVQNPIWQLICTASTDVRAFFQNTQLPENIHLLSKVPQLELLPKLDVFITHGGLNSIQEALHFKVPTLNYPLNMNCDHPGNAARIFHHRLGLRGEIDSDSPQEITSKINELLTNPIYRQNLHEFKEKTEANYTEERVLKLFEQLFPSQEIAAKI